MNTIWDLNNLMKEINDRYDSIMEESRKDPDNVNYRNFNMLFFSIDRAYEELAKGLRESKGEENA